MIDPHSSDAASARPAMASAPPPGKGDVIPLRLVYSYAHEDAWCRDELATMLAPLRNQGQISDWYDGLIAPGSDWDAAIWARLDGADIILLLVSKHYLRSEYCQREMAAALDRWSSRSATVVPVIVGPCLWQTTELRHLQAVPPEPPVSRWENLEDAIFDVATRLLQVINAGSPRAGSRGRTLTDLAVEAAARWNVPHPASPNFANRQRLLADLESKLATHRAVALHGGAGLGKSMLAIEYANRFRERYSLVWWLRAEDAETGASDVLGLARALGLRGDVQEGRAKALKRLAEWCGSRDDYLLILDNAPSQAAVDELLPWDLAGHVVLTTRDSGWKGSVATLEVPPWSLDESVDYLLRRTGETDAEGARKLVEMIGGVPLALEQVAALILSRPAPDSAP